MDLVAQLAEAVSLLTKLTAEVRNDRLNGAGGGLCRLKGRWVFFVDEEADTATQLDRALAALADLANAEGLYMSPALRDRFDALKAERAGQETDP